MFHIEYISPKNCVFHITLERSWIVVQHDHVQQEKNIIILSSHGWWENMTRVDTSLNDFLSLILPIVIRHLCIIVYKTPWFFCMAKGSRDIRVYPSCPSKVYGYFSSQLDTTRLIRVITQDGERELSYMNISLIHPTQKLDTLHICCQFISNDLKQTNLKSLILLLVPNQFFLKYLLNFILFQGFYIGWMRSTLVYDNSLCPYKTSIPHPLFALGIN